MQDWKLGFIGTGVMAETMIAGVLRGGALPAARIVSSDPHAPRRDAIAQRLGVHTTASNREVAEAADLVVLAVKPQSLPKVFQSLEGTDWGETQVLSIVAGAPIASLAAGLGHDKVARAMPNLPCRIHRGMTVWTGASGADAERVALVLDGMGEARRTDSEAHIDMATAVSGTGPAIVAEFVKSMMEAANYVGLPRELARDTVLATVLGTAEMIRTSDAHVADLIDAVTSPAGTTSRALQVLKNGRFGATLTDSIDAAHRRTSELGAALEAQLKE